MKIIEERARQACKDLQTKGVYRQFRDLGPNLRLNLASNDYLGVVKNGLLRSSLARHASLCGTGGAASRLVFGTTKHHRLLEEKLADHFGYESALVFTSGFMANYGLCSALRELADTVVIDKRIHASMVDGLMQSMGGKTDIRSFKHNDVGH
ncbi:MAG: aminotransferase class I/II-fold pyridoxal phosphate-dependent enzyme, partial [Acidobacteriota bacterium]